jgi:predicted TIM-barrel fold metal-dependent hydrolase
VPRDMPLDSPALDPLWAVADELELTIVLHAFTFTPPYAPGALDGSFYDNAWLARSAAHPWGGMRNIAALLGSGVLDRHSRLRVALLEAGQGWLPYWVHRLEEQASYMSGALPPGLRPFGEYVRSGRYFQSIELHEGEKLTKGVIEDLGDDLLMFSTDYPHGESWFPKATEAFLGWDLDEETRRKLLWDNAMACFPRFTP